MLYPITLTDKVLLKRFSKALPGLGYRDLTATSDSRTHEEEIRRLLVDMLREARHSKDFSIFTYAVEKKREDGDDDSIFKLWRTGLLAALHVLKRHDRRENPSQDKNVTPPLTEELVSYYRKLREYEPLLYASDPRYRDHFAHVLRVWMLGVVVANALADPDKALRLSLLPGKEISPPPFSKEERLAVYTIAALTHDMGYPIEKLFKLNKAVGEMFTAYGGLDLQNLEFAFSAPHHQMAQDTMKLIAAKPRYHGCDDEPVEKKISRWLLDYRKIKHLDDYQRVNEEHQNVLKVGLRCQWKYFQKYARALERSQHGFLSTLLLQRKLLFFREGEFALEEDYNFALEEVRQFVIRREILRAVATHTCPDIYFMSATSPEALLFFCDEIQDWGRPRFQQLYEGDITGKPVTVTLKRYTESSVSWETVVQPDSLKEFAAIVFGIAHNLYTRLRSAPDSRRRGFSLLWTCKSNEKAHPLKATFEFVHESEMFRLDIQRPGRKAEKARDILDSVVTGAKSPDQCKKLFLHKVEKACGLAKK